jgi:phenylalanine-4-hydroxylase
LKKNAEKFGGKKKIPTFAFRNGEKPLLQLAKTPKISVTMRQEYSKYTSEDHLVWSLLYKEQMEHLPAISTDAYLDGIQRIKFESDKIPDFNIINEELAKITGWQVYVVPGLIANKPFFEHLVRKEFPATTWLRKLEQLKYLPEPDMFHDVFGHVPLLAEPFFCDYLQGVSDIALQHIDNPTAVELISRIYWFTVEFGLIRESGELKIYGAGILSSPGESKFSVSTEATHVPFDIQTILDTPYIKDRYQDKYFVIDSYQQLFESLPLIKQSIQQYVDQGVEVAPSP